MGWASSCAALPRTPRRSGPQAPQAQPRREGIFEILLTASNSFLSRGARTPTAPTRLSLAVASGGRFWQRLLRGASACARSGHGCGTHRRGLWRGLREPEGADEPDEGHLEEVCKFSGCRAATGRDRDQAAANSLAPLPSPPPPPHRARSLPRFPRAKSCLCRCARCWTWTTQAAATGRLCRRATSNR